jgi:hypothetical protein
VAVALALGGTGAASAAGAPATGVLALTAPAQVAGGQGATLSGKLTGAPAGSAVRLYASPYPYPVASLIATTASGADGSFSFTVHPDRSTHYRVMVPALPGAQELADIAVTAKSITKVKPITPGQALVTVVVFHPRDLPWAGAPVDWSFATGPHGAFVSAGATRARRLSPYVIALRTQVALPAGPFRFRACLDAPGDHALLSAQPARDCTGLGYSGGGSLPVGYPAPPAVAQAAGYLAGRAGRTAFAVVDSEGRVSGVRIRETFNTASVVKAMLLVGYLRRLDAQGQRRIDPFSASFLYPMIHVSDNNAATQCWSIVGDAGLYAVARSAGMTDFSVSGSWGTAQLSPADQARFFFEMDSLVPREFVGYERFLLSTIVGWQTWSIPVVARPLGYNVFFKDGSEPTGLGQLVHQVARLEGHGRTFAMAVMTDGDPSMLYGEATIQGVAAALLR